MFKTILGKKWYYRLHGDNGLLMTLRRSPLLIVMRILPVNDTFAHLYAEFLDYFEFWNYYLKTPPVERCFNEVPVAEVGQKLRFDLDMVNSSLYEAQILITCLTHACHQVLAQYSVDLNLYRDIILFTSTTIENSDPHFIYPKLSYHLIILNYYCFDAIDARHVGLHIIDTAHQFLPIEYQTRAVRDKWLDRAVFDPNHPLRIYGSTKPNSHRVKQWLPTWIYLSDPPTQITTQLPSYDNVNVLRYSLISWVKDCKMLKVEVPQLPELPTLDIDERILLQIPKWLEKVDPDQAFKLDQQKGSRIWLTRLKPSYCTVCKGIHESMNPFFEVTANQILFCCGRSKEKIVVEGNAERWLIKDEESLFPVSQSVVDPPVVRSQFFEVKERLAKLRASEN